MTARKPYPLCVPCPFCETYISDEQDACCNELRLSREVRRLRRLLRVKNAKLRAAEKREEGAK